MRNLGRVEELWRFPVKSMQGERLETAQISAEGLAGDRAYALLDVEQDKIVSAKSVKRFPDIFSYRATFNQVPRAGSPLPPVDIEMPHGDVVSSAADDVDGVLSSCLGRAVKLIRVGEREPVPYHDASPISLLTDSTMMRFREIQPGSDFDVRRFRMNVIIDCEQAGFAENEWIHQLLEIGSEVRLKVTQPNARCVMTTLAQDELPQDREIFTTMVRHNRLKLENNRRFPCAGVYARVISGGMVIVGDTISL